MDKERINYVISKGMYIGASVNLPFVCQADSFEELQRSVKEMGCAYFGELTKQMMQDEPFEFVQVETFIK